MKTALLGMLVIALPVYSNNTTTAHQYHISPTPTPTRATTPVSTIVPRITPATSIVIRRQPLRAVVNIAYYPRQQHQDITDSVRSCCTQHHPERGIDSLIENHINIMAPIICIPALWPCLIGIMVAGSFCNPPIPDGHLCGQSISCCLPQRTIALTALGMLAQQVANVLQRNIRLSELITLWLGPFMGHPNPEQLFSATMPLPNLRLDTAMSESIQGLMGHTSLGLRHQYLENNVLIHLPSFNTIIATSPHPESITDVLTIAVLSDWQDFVYVFHQTASQLNVLDAQTMISNSTRYAANFTPITRIGGLFGVPREDERNLILITFFIQR